MRTEKQKLCRHITLITLGTFAITLAGCVAYPPEGPPGHYHDGYYSTYDYPNTYYYYDAYGHPYREDYDYPSGYSNDPNLRYDARDRGAWHSDDHNFHNRDDFDHWDY